MDSERQKLEELKERAKEKFTKQEIDDFINMGTKLAAKVIYNVLAETVNDYMQRDTVSVDGSKIVISKSNGTKIIKKINKVSPKQPASYLSIDLEELGNECPHSKLNVCLAPKPSGYITTVDIPKEYVQDLYQKYNMLKHTAVATWRQICQDQPTLIKLVREYMPNIDFSELVIDEKQPTSMYFDPDCKTRVSIFAYYVGKDGKMYYKK